MPNIIKYSLTSSSNSIQSGNFNVAVNNTPTNLTGFHNGICPINGGYTIYINKESNGPSIYAPKNDTQLIQITNSLGGNVLTAADALVWINSQSNMTVLNNNYPSIVTDGLVLNVDSSFVSSYPKTGTTWRDFSSNKNNGTLINGPTYSSTDGGSIVFDGIDDRVNVPHIPSYNLSTLTVLVWIKPTSPYTGTFRNMICKQGADRDWNFYLYSSASNGVVNFYHLSTARASSYPSVVSIPGGSLSLDVWHQCGFSISGGILKYILDGVVISQGGTNFSSANSSYPISIGGADNYTKGDISVSQVYNRGLSDNEILQNYYAGLQRLIPTNGLVLSLDAQNTNLYATSPTTAYDISGNDNNGAMLNGVQYIGDGNGSWKFDGVDDLIIVTSKPTNYIPTSGNFTIIGWIKRNSTTTPLGDRESIFSNTGSADGFRFQIGSGGVLFSLIGGVGGAGYTEGSMGSGYNVADGNWHQVGVMFDRTGTLGSYKAYAIFDGIIIGNRNIASTNNVFTNQNAGISYACCSTYKGTVSTLSVYSRLLTQTEITTIYNATKSRYGL